MSLNFKALNPQQQAAVKHGQGPLLVVAGAGTGKTQVITNRVAHLINGLKTEPSQILAITFTAKAAREMEGRVIELLGSYIFDVNITTFNAFGFNLLRRFSYELGLNQQLSLLNETQQLVFMREHLDQFKLNYYSPVTNPEGMLADLAAYFSKLKDELIDPEAYAKFARGGQTRAKSRPEKIEAGRHLELARAYGAYQKLLRQNNLVDFADQVALAVELLTKRANVASKIQAELKYLLVDEFQDTNPAQSRLIDLLSGRAKNVMVVGDDDQSIYRFRGAAVANVLEFKQRYPKAKQLALVENYRSSQEILDSAYRLIQHNNPDRLEARYQIDKQLRGQFQSSPPQLKTFLTHEEEAGWIATDIKRRLSRGQSPTEIAILLRKNSQARILEKYLQTAGVDYQLVGQTEDLYRQPTVKVLLNWLRMVVDPKATEPLYHLLVSPVYAVESGWLRHYVTTAKRQHQTLETILVQAVEVEETDDKIGAIGQFLTQLARWREQLPELSVGQLSYQFLDNTGYLKHLITQAKNDPAVDQQIADLNQFFTTLLDFERIANDNTAVGYLEALPTLLGSGERTAIEDLPEVFGNQVRLLTVHRAKGLEFETAYLFDLSQETFPSRRLPSSLEIPPHLQKDAAVLSGNPHLQEERRLMYVAMTRAKKELILTYSPDHGGARSKRPSQFIEETLGERPELSKLKPRLRRTDQIELFKVSARKSSPGKVDLPPTILKGKQLVLTERQIEDYLMCPAEFRLRHLIAPPQPLTFALEYGNLMHSLIQLYNRQRLEGNRSKLQDLEKYLSAQWPSEVFVSPGHAERSLAQAQKTLRAFWQRENKTKRQPTLVERSFEFNLPEIATTVRGRFDAVYHDKSGIEIRDYKTGAATVTSQEKANQRAQNSLQLAIYALGWRKIKGAIPDTASLDFLDSGFIGQVHKTTRQLDTVEAKIEKVARGIRVGDFRPAGSHVFCTHTQYGF